MRPPLVKGGGVWRQLPVTYGWVTWDARYVMGRGRNESRWVEAPSFNPLTRDSVPPFPPPMFDAAFFDPPTPRAQRVQRHRPRKPTWKFPRFRRRLASLCEIGLHELCRWGRRCTCPHHGLQATQIG